jgi:hypothetical protein
MNRLLTILSLLGFVFWSYTVYAYEVGNSQWCRVDSLGNLTCYYFSPESCWQEVRLGGGTCIMNPHTR